MMRAYDIMMVAIPMFFTVGIASTELFALSAYITLSVASLFSIVMMGYGLFYNPPTGNGFREKLKRRLST